MAKQVLLVSEQRLKQWTQLDDNVRLNEITPHILQASDIYIQNLVGSKLYARLQAGIIANDLNTDEKLLLDDYIGKTLMQYALYMILPSIKYKVVNQGIVNGTSEETAPTTLEELRYLRGTVLDTAEFYATRLVEFFRDNPGMFPEYTNPGTDGMMPDKTDQYFSGLQTNIPLLRNQNNLWIYADCGTDCDPDCSSCN
jgi:hypothetical protein